MDSHTVARDLGSGMGSGVVPAGAVFPAGEHAGWVSMDPSQTPSCKGVGDRDEGTAGRGGGY